MSLLRENRKLILQSILGFLFIGLMIYFISHEQAELHNVMRILGSAKLWLVVAGIGVTFFYLFLQGLMYHMSFRTVGQKVHLAQTTRIYLKRNFIGVFLPAGGVASLAFFTRDLEKRNVPLTNIHFASSIYAFTGILTVIIVAVPVLLYTLIARGISSEQILAFAGACVLVGIIILAFLSILRKGPLHRLLVKWFPSVEKFFEELKAISVNKKYFIITIAISLLIEITGMVHLSIAMIALGFPFEPGTAVIAYVVSVLFMIVSPFLRGLGAIELSMTIVLTRYGFSTVDAISITLLYRFFEFWLPLVLSGLSFIFVRNNLLLRIIPAVLTFSLGIINIISAITPAIPSRLHALHEFLPLAAIHASNYFVLVVGLFLLVVTAFLLKGLRTAWILAVILSVISLVGHITKAIDYEESLLALFVTVTLFVTQKQYFVKEDPRLGQIGLRTSLISIVAVITYGIIGFYFLDKKYFSIDFSFRQSVIYTIENFFLFQSPELVPSKKFAQDFLYSINIAGFLSMAFLLYTLVRPYVFRPGQLGEEREKAKSMVTLYGRSSLDYFKTYSDKLLFIGTTAEGFVSYRVAGNYAMVLENPVCPNADSMKKIIIEFEKFCHDHGLKCFYYRVPEESVPVYSGLGKRSLLFGQEAILDITDFTLDGGEKKSIRNSCSKAKQSGFFIRFHHPPVFEGVLQKIKLVSMEWLEDTDSSEMVFSQGLFDAKELKNQVIVTVENHEEKIVAFLNLVPDYAEGEMTFDLIRKVKDSPNGVVEFLLAETIFYGKSRGYRTFNLGLVPMSGISRGKDIPEFSIRFAYEKLGTFVRYKGLREFKEKFGPAWYNRYIIYDNHYDLFNLPVVLNKVIKP